MSRLEKKTNSIATGATILVAANFIVKIIGVIYKIPLANILDEKGNAYLGSAYEIYQLMLSIFASGGALAVSKMVSESMARQRYSEVRKFIRLMMIMFIVMGTLGTMIMFLGSGVFSQYVSDPDSRYCMMVLSPALLFLSISCVFRGYFQGLQNMKPTAISQVVEATFKLAIGIGLGAFLVRAGVDAKFVAAGAISGTSISTVIGASLLAILYFLPFNRQQLRSLKERGGEERSTGKLLRTFWRIAIPLAASALVVNLTGTLDLFLIYDRLQASGLDTEAATIAYGGYKGYAQTLFNLPPSIISSLNISILPALSAALVRKDRARVQSVASRALKLVIVLALPCAVGLSVLAGPIQRMLFPNQLDGIPAVTPLLRLLGIASFWACLSTVTTVLLQSAGKMRIPVYSLIVGGVIKLTTNYFLIPVIGMAGAPIGTILCYLVIFFINIYSFRRTVPIRLHIVKMSVRPAISCLVMALAGLASQTALTSVLGDRLATLVAILVSALVYGLLMLLMGGINADDVHHLPKGRTIARLLTKLHLLRSLPVPTAPAPEGEEPPCDPDSLK